MRHNYYLTALCRSILDEDSVCAKFVQVADDGKSIEVSR
jgi:hypothetical protein